MMVKEESDHLNIFKLNFNILMAFKKYNNRLLEPT